MALGDRIKEARKKKGLTQKELADMINAKHNSISNWENNQNKPDPDTIELLCGALDADPSWLLMGEAHHRLLSYHNSLKKLEADSLVNELIELYNALNKAGKQEALKRIKELTYIPMYSDSITLNAAHERTDIDIDEDMKKQDDEIMYNDDEWK